MNNKFFYTLGGILLLSLLIKLFGFATPDDNLSRQQLFNEKYYVFALNTPKNLTFAGEKVPVDQFDVRERMDRELLLNTYWQSQTMLYHKRANRWFPVIIPILKRNGIPDDFKYLALAESGFTHLTSPAGAVGYWQFLEATAKSYGLEINDEVDERYNVEKATEAACKYFKESYSLLGSWALVAASYNMGIGGIRKQIEKQKVKSYYDLLLNEETFRYLFRILALKEIISKPKAYGYQFRKQDLYAPYEYTVVVVDSGISNLADFAKKFDLNYKYLKLLNPWLRQNSLSNKQRKAYTLKLLKPGFTGLEDGMEGTEADTTSSGSTASPQGSYLVSTPDLKEEAPEEKKPAEKKRTDEEVSHVIEKGENLNLIARRYDVSVQDIKAWNNIRNERRIKAGQKLFVSDPRN
jgi:membrane-bound lytic murein transglycosylase D